MYLNIAILSYRTLNLGMLTIPSRMINMDEWYREQLVCIFLIEGIIFNDRNAGRSARYIITLNHPLG